MSLGRARAGDVVEVQPRCEVVQQVEQRVEVAAPEALERGPVRGDPRPQRRREARAANAEPPGGVWNWLNEPHTLNGVLALPVQYSAYGVFSSAFAETSGSSRHGAPVLASAHSVDPFPCWVKELFTPGPNW